jgi:hypothetical protein
MISITFLKSKVGGNFATAAISGLQLQRSLSEETAKVHKLQVKVVKHEKAFQVKSTELTLAQTKILQLQSALKCRLKGKSEGQQSRGSGCCLKSYERLVIILAHLWKLAAGFLHTKFEYTDFLPHYQFTFENKILCLSIQISPHLVSSHINLCNFVSGHWNAGWRKSKKVSRN